MEDLKGKTIGVTRFGSVTDNLTRMILKKNGLENTVNVRQVRGIAQASAAFQNKQIAGAVTSSVAGDVCRQLDDRARGDQLDFRFQ